MTSQRMMPEDVDEYALDRGILGDDLEGCRDLLFVGPAPDIEEVGGSPRHA